MKILIIQCFDKPGGQSNRSYLFADKLQQLGHDVTYFTNKYNHLDDKNKFQHKFNLNKNIKYIFANNKQFKNNKVLSVVINIFTLFKIKYDFDITIAPSVPLINSFFGLIISKLNRSNFFYEIRDIWPDALVYKKKISKLNPLYFFLKILEIIIYKFSDGVISALPYSKNYINSYNKDIPFLYLPNSYDSYPTLKKKFNKKKTKVVYIGRFNDGHDIKVILDAAEYLSVKKNFSNISFYFYGYGKKINYIKRTIIKKKLKKVFYKRKLDKEEIFHESKKYDIAICTITESKHYQWGINLNKIYEYMNSSLPILFCGNIHLNPILKANCGYISKVSDYKELSKNILVFNSLSHKKKKLLSTNSKNFFEKNYNLKKATKKLEIFLKSSIIKFKYKSTRK